MQIKVNLRLASQRRSGAFAILAGLPLMASAPMAIAGSPCTTYTYVGKPYDYASGGSNLLKGHITASITLSVPSGYTGSVGSESVVGFTVNPNDNVGLTIVYPSPLMTFAGSPVSSCYGQNADFTLSKGKITSWGFGVYNASGSYPNFSCFLYSGGDSVLSDEMGSSSFAYGNPLLYDFDDAAEPFDETAFVGTESMHGKWTLSSLNPPPIPENITVLAKPNTTLSINLSAGSSCGATSASLATNPMQGQVTGFPNTTVSYKANESAAGSDSFQFTLNGSSGTSTKATVSITLNPIAIDQTASTIAGTPVTINLAAGASGSPASAALVGSPVGGMVSGFPNTYVTFTPNDGSTAASGFNFSLSNSVGTSNTALVTVWPTLLSTQTKALFSQIGSSLQQTSESFEYASIVAEGPKNLIKNVEVEIANHVFSEAIAGDDQLTGQKVDFMTGSVEFAAFDLERLTKTNVVSIPLEVDSLIFSFAALGSNIIANDPPDSNYKVVFRPKTLSFPKTGNAIVDKASADYLSYASLSAATVHAAERWQGATLAGDQTYIAFQAAAVKNYSQQLMNAESVLKSDNVALATALPPVDISSFPDGATAISAAYNNQCGKPLPNNLNARLLSVGLSQVEIDSLVCKYAHAVTPFTVSTGFRQALQTPLP